MERQTPVFVKVEDYKDVLDIMELVKNKLIEAKKTIEEINAVKFVLNRFFTENDGVYTQKHIEEDIIKYKKNSKTNSRIAREREENRRNKLTKRERIVNEVPPNQEPLTKNQEPINNIHQLIVDEYTRVFNGELPMIAKITTKRKSAINGCIKQMFGTEHDFKEIETWTRYFNYISELDFLMGRKTDWKADFDFLITKSKMIKRIAFANLVR